MKHPVKNELSHTCRNCINERYGLRLRSRDCYYLQYPAPCRACGEVRNIVADLAAPAKIKVWLMAGLASRKSDM